MILQPVQRKPRQTGFTLLEVMIATALLAVMMALLLGGMRIGADSWQQGERLAERATRLLVVDNFFRAQLGDLQPLFEAQPLASALALPPKPVFSGGPTRLDFAGTLPPQVRGGLYRFRLYLAEEGDRNDLKLSLRPFSTGDQRGDEPIEDVLVLENVESLRFSYFKKGNTGAESQWVEEWKEVFLPSLIRIEVGLRGEPPWPAILVAPRAETGQ